MTFCRKKLKPALIWEIDCKHYAEQCGGKMHYWNLNAKTQCPKSTHTQKYAKSIQQSRREVYPVIQVTSIDVKNVRISAVTLRKRNHNDSFFFKLKEKIQTFYRCKRHSPKKILYIILLLAINPMQRQKWIVKNRKIIKGERDRLQESHTTNNNQIKNNCI